MGSENEKKPIAGQIVMLNPAKIRTSNRIGMDRMERDLSAILESIVEFGVLQAVGVMLGPDGEFTLAYGHRRVAAAIKCGLEKISCVVVDTEDGLPAFIAENTIRTTLDPFDLICARRADMVRRGMNQEEYAIQVLHISPATFCEQMSLFKLSSEILDRHRSDRVLSLRALKRVRVKDSLAEMHAAYERELHKTVAKRKKANSNAGRANTNSLPQPTAATGGNNNPGTPSAPPSVPAGANGRAVAVQSAPQPVQAGTNAVQAEGLPELAVFTPVPPDGTGANPRSQVDASAVSGGCRPHGSLEWVVGLFNALNLACAGDAVRNQVVRIFLMLAAESCSDPESIRLLLSAQRESIRSTKSIQRDRFSSNSRFSVLNFLLRLLPNLERKLKMPIGEKHQK